MIHRHRPEWELRSINGLVASEYRVVIIAYELQFVSLLQWIGIAYAISPITWSSCVMNDAYVLRCTPSYLHTREPLNLTTPASSDLYASEPCEYRACGYNHRIYDASPASLSRHACRIVWSYVYDGTHCVSFVVNIAHLSIRSSCGCNTLCVIIPRHSYDTHIQSHTALAMDRIVHHRVYISNLLKWYWEYL